MKTTYCVSCKKDTEDKNEKISKPKNGKLMLKSTCSVCGNKKTRFISKNEGSGLLSSLRIKTPLSKIPRLNILFKYKKINKENNDIINKFLLVGEKFMPEMHLWDSKVGKYSACGPFTKHQQRIDRFMKDGRLNHLYKNKLDKACFQHHAAYNKYKDLKNRTRSDIVLKNKAYKIAADLKVDGFQRALASMVWKFFDERSRKVLGSGIENQQLAEELHKPIIRNFKRRKVYSSYKDNIWGVDLFDMQLISKFNKRIKYVLCALIFLVDMLGLLV